MTALYAHDAAEFPTVPTILRRDTVDTATTGLDNYQIPRDTVVLIGGPAHMKLIPDIEFTCQAITIAEESNGNGEFNSRGLWEYAQPPKILHTYRPIILTDGTREFLAFRHSCEDCNHEHVDPHDIPLTVVALAINTLLHDPAKKPKRRRHAKG